MAVARWLETDSLSNQNISSAASIGVYTADADRMIVCDVSIDQAAGGGDYVIYLTRQINGAGSSYVLLPKTTCTAAAGETAIAMQSGPVTVRSGDVVTCYVDGLAGDTTTPDTTVRWFEMAALKPTMADRTLDVSTGGEAGIDLANVGSPTTTLNLSGTTVKTATDIETDTADIQTRIPAALIGGRIDAALSAAGLATDAGEEIAGAVRTELAVELAHIDIDISSISGGSGLTAQETRDAMKLAPTAGAPAAGSVDAHLDAIQAVTDALDVSAVTQVAASSAGHLTITVGLTFDEGVTGLTIPADWVTALWTLKNNARDADTAALVQLRATNPAAGSDGLQRLNGAALVAPITAADGELTVTQATGRIDVWLSDEMTAMLGAATAIGWDVKFIDASGDSSGQRGTADVVLTETKATS